MTTKCVIISPYLNDGKGVGGNARQYLLAVARDRQFGVVLLAELVVVAELVE